MVVEPIHNGIGKVRISDTLWRAASEVDVAYGETVRIHSADGGLFDVVPVSAGHQQVNTDEKDG